MTAINPQDFIDLAVDLCTDFGRAAAVTFTRKVDASYSTSALEPTETTDVTYIVNAAVIPATPDLMEKLGFNNAVGAKLVYIPGVDTSDATVNPKINDTAVIDETCRIMQITAYETQSVKCAYFLMMGR